MNSALSFSLVVLSGLALVAGKPRWAGTLAISALAPWLIWPFVEALLGALPIWLAGVILPLLLIAVFFMGLRRSLGLLGGGDDVAAAAIGHVLGVWLVRASDAFYQILRLILTLPIRLVVKMSRPRG